jgi:transcription elongation factor GreA-like protein
MELHMKGFDKGDRVAHGQYGVGTLTDVNEYHTVIDFDEHGVHKFITGMVVLERSSTPAPPRPAKGARKGTSRTRART